MGNYNLKSGVFRCENCFSIYKIKIIPCLPESDVILQCKCISTQKTVKNFLLELNKGTKYKIECFQCKKLEDKNALYCNDCNHIYCIKCIKNHQKHKYIILNKKDFYCVFHQKENFCAFCKDCDINLCQKCLEGKKHLNHDKIYFSKIIMNKTERNFLNDKFNLAQEKIIFNTELIHAFVKKIKNKGDINKLINLEKENTNQNKLIIELIKFLEYLYDNSRFKNYNIIHNFIENVNLNVNKFKFNEDKVKKENAIEKIIKYLKEDFILIKDDENVSKTDLEKNEVLDDMWDIGDGNEIMTKKTMYGTINFNIDLDEDNNINDNGEKLDKNEKKNMNKINDINNIKKENKKINKKNLDDNDIYGRKRRKAFFVPSKIVEQKLKEKEEIKIKEEKINNRLDNNDKIKEIKIKEKEDKINDNKIDKIDKIEENKISKDNKYINYLSINRFRNRHNSVINLMMINGFRKRKIFNIEIDNSK
jgi:hypothetical protein